jgi:hypothetical protein
VAHLPPWALIRSNDAAVWLPSLIGLYPPPPSSQ